MKPSKVEFSLGENSITLETGRVARQATGSVMAHMDDTSVLCTVVAAKEAIAGQSFFPLTVDYQERTYAAGRIPGGFFRREGRPTEKETLTCRLIDRPIRPLFPDGFRNEVHVIATVMSVDRDVDPDIIAMIGTSAALSLSGIPFAGPIGANRVGFVDNMYVLNPRYSSLENSMLNMVVAGTENAVLMVESEAQQLSEDQMLGAVLFAHDEMQIQIQAINQLVEAVGKEKWVYTPPVENAELKAKVESRTKESIKQAYSIREKVERRDRIDEIQSQLITGLVEEDESLEESEIKELFQSLAKDYVRDQILSGKSRIDGRRPDRVRDLDLEVGTLRRTHGSSFFQRGETQAIVTVTLGMTKDAAFIDALSGEFRDYFLLHYNFPPYSVGETGRLLGPKRREVGHGRLARRAIESVLPDQETFPYTIRVVSEITESNGSSSMASVCGASMALMDAGVPVTDAVAGIAMGLIKENDKYVVLTDILGDEDHLGDMDFKVAGTEKGVTALQMDIKIDGITEEIMSDALAQAFRARQFILRQMNGVIAKPREDLSQYAPIVFTLKVKADQVREVIGKGGATIRALQEETGAMIEINDFGEIKIYAENADIGEAAERKIKALTREPEVGGIYEGEVRAIMDFGAFVQVAPNKDGLVHISRISNSRVERVSDVLSVGQIVEVVVIEIDPRGRISLSMKDVEKYRNTGAAGADSQD